MLLFFLFSTFRKGAIFLKVHLDTFVYIDHIEVCTVYVYVCLIKRNIIVILDSTSTFRIL